MKLAHIKLVDNDKPFNHPVTLCGVEGKQTHFVGQLVFCSMPNEMRCQACKHELLEMLK